LFAVASLALTLTAAACGVLPYVERPAAGYAYGSGEPLRVAVVDETGGDDWAPAIARTQARYQGATPYLAFQSTGDPNIIVTVRRYSDVAPPSLEGYAFQPGVGGFAAVYDAAGRACNFPPSPLPLNCSGEIARAEIYVNDIIPAGADIEERRERLVLHELGHALGLTRHSPDLGIGQLAQRYGWPRE
jgi:hypothetical protein